MYLETRIETAVRKSMSDVEDIRLLTEELAHERATTVERSAQVAQPAVLLRTYWNA